MSRWRIEVTTLKGRNHFAQVRTYGTGRVAWWWFVSTNFRTQVDSGFAATRAEAQHAAEASLRKVDGGGDGE